MALDNLDNVARTAKGQSVDGGGRTEVDGTCEGTLAFQPCPITDKDEMPFRLMDLPTEIRLEIYRACLTRPYPILLSRQPQLPKSEARPGLGSSADNASRAQHRRAMRATASHLPAQTTSSHIANAPPQSAVALPARNTAAGTGSGFQLLVTAVGPQAGWQTDLGRDRSGEGTGVQRNQRGDPLLTSILRVNKEVYKEARGVLYSENYFTLDLNTAQSTLACLHQRSRRQIKHIELEIPSYNDILERFQETVRLSLRYCSGLKECCIHMPFMLPGADGSGTSGNTTVYANGFDILRWLPQECNIVLEGATCVEIEQVVSKHRHLAKTLDKLAYARRQLISNETGQPQA
ncbi:uncharacterized protein RCC_10583 [Ramularia collo-cygni]|uniref:F-box domain-containing protein n=1 Tax=Ramularia collo-cygni TaxID=112498 RepID=A0A2D3VFZ9_9PEZI|nr:uncharacterized protein RCC_10583 [Ramularia collo-cygni]CZT24855.1 uncharacterized protein RCC_10583 [Ramularia collo-cygni]